MFFLNKVIEIINVWQKIETFLVEVKGDMKSTSYTNFGAQNFRQMDSCANYQKQWWFFQRK